MEKTVKKIKGVILEEPMPIKEYKAMKHKESKTNGYICLCGSVGNSSYYIRHRMTNKCLAYHKLLDELNTERQK